MTKILRIGAPTPSMTSHQDGKHESVKAPRSELAITAPQARAQAGLHVEIPRPRTQANFLAQFIDQHTRWPRAPHRKDRKRERASRAYIDADMLPEVLAEALRLHPVDKKI